MTYDRIERELSEARDDYAHATAALLRAESEAARKRHERRARTAARRIYMARRELAEATCERVA